MTDQQVLAFEEKYLKDGEDGYTCKKCGAVILGAQVVHSLWLKGMAGGFGETETELVPYCPNCEPVPNPYGSPIYYGESSDRDVQDLRKILRQ